MAFLGNLFGTNNQANIQDPVNQAQLNQTNASVGQGLGYQQNLIEALQGANGVGKQNDVFAQQQQLANMLQQNAQGGGPNPAQAQLAQATQQNVANQAALMAGQRGSGANVGLLARQAAQQGGNLQQQAVGQAAVMRAQQQLAGQQALGQQQAQMAGLASNQVGNQNSASQGYTNSALQQQANLLHTKMAANQLAGQMGEGNASRNSQLVGGLVGGAGAAMSMAEGGQVSGPSSFAGKFMTGFGQAEGGQNNPYAAGFQQFGKGLHTMLNKPANPLQGQVGQLGSSDLSMSTVPNMAAKGGVMDYRDGGKLPGKAEIKGDSYTNDKVPIIGSPGEIMLPRSVTMHKDAPEKAKQFVEAILAKKKLRK